MRTTEQPFIISDGIYKYKGLRRRMVFSGMLEHRLGTKFLLQSLLYFFTNTDPKVKLYPGLRIKRVVM